GWRAPSGIPWAGRKCRPPLRIPAPVPPHGRPLAVLLPELRLPRPRQAGRGKPDGDQSLRPRQGPPHAPLSHLSAPVLRAQGDAAVRRPAPTREGRRGPGTHRRGVRRPPDRAALQGEPQHRRPPEPTGRRARPRPPRRVRGFFPRTPVRPSSTRSGRSSPRRRRTATPRTRPTTARGTPGATSRATPRAGWS